MFPLYGHCTIAGLLRGIVLTSRLKNAKNGRSIVLNVRNIESILKAFSIIQKKCFV